MTVSSISSPAKSRPSLASRLKSGVSATPLKIVVHGQEGVGKTTLASQAPAPIFIAPEKGFGLLGSHRLSPENWLDAIELLRMIRAEGKEYKTVVLDTADWMEALCWEHLCKINHVDSIEKVGGGYGKGYTAAYEQFRLMFSEFDQLQEQGKHVIILAHSAIRPFNPPEGTPYDRYAMKLNKQVAGLLAEWADVLLFARFKTFTSKERGAKKAYATGGQEREMRTSHDALFDAKNRFGLPETLPLDWDSFWSAYQESLKAVSTRCETVRNDIRKLLEQDSARLARAENNFITVGDDYARLVNIRAKLTNELQPTQES